MLPTFRTRVPLSPSSSTALNGLELVFDRFFGDDGNWLKSTSVRDVVPMSVWQDDDHVYFEAELPGVAEKDLEISLHKGVLTVKGQSRDQDGREYLYNSRRFGSFERVVTLPEVVDSEQVDATLSGGILRIRLTKLPQARPRKITLKTSEATPQA
jgi:HSP20 family protein